MLIFEYLLHQLGAIAAFILSIIFWKKNNGACKLLIIQVFQNLTVETTGFIFKHLNISSRALYNVHLLVEFCLFYTIPFLLSEIRKIYLWLGITLFTAIWLFDQYINNTPINKKYFKYAFSFESLFLCFIYFVLFYNTALDTNKKIYKNPNFYLCLGMIIFYGCDIPWFALFNDLVKLFPQKTQRTFLWNSIFVLDNINYFLIGYSIYLVGKAKKPIYA